jgi:type IV pilus assembly protein PilO
MRLVVKTGFAKDPRRPWKVALAILAVANLVALILIYKPFGGSVNDLENQLRGLQATVRAEQGQLKHLRALANKVAGARGVQERFIHTYFMDRRTTSSTILSEIDSSAHQAGLKPRELTFIIEPVEGSDTISMMTVTGNFEGSYADLVQFVNLVDRSQRFLIIDTLQAAPLQTAGVLAARVRMNTFIQERGAPGRSMGAPKPDAPEPAAIAAGAQP